MNIKVDNQKYKMKIESVKIKDLKPHPSNYREHPDDEIKHLIDSIKENGIYRNIVIAKDNTILAGHGVVMACKKIGIESIDVIRLNIESSSPEAIKVLIGDNEIAHLGMINDRQLSELLKTIKEQDDLIGTGYDEMMLANLIFISRPTSEIKDFNEAAEWVGMPDYENSSNILQITMNFKTIEDRIDFAKLIGLKLTNKTRSAWYPIRPNDDMKNVRFEDV